MNLEFSPLYILMGVFAVLLSLLLLRFSQRYYYDHQSQHSTDRELNSKVRIIGVTQQPVSTIYAKPRNLTKREKEVARLVARGKTNSEIAQKLSIKVSTVGSYLQSIYRKQDIHSRSDLIKIMQNNRNHHGSKRK